jgi:glucosamine-6-phosphate deaminase
MSIQPVESKTIDLMHAHIFESKEKLGQRAADDLATLLSRLVGKQGKAAVILAAGKSQLTFFGALRTLKGVPWEKVTLFHMDEYLGMPNQHPASFARFIQEKLVNFVNPASFHHIRGDSSDVDSELKRYKNLLREFPPDICVMGIGENGHLAFNDPPADFETKEVIHVVNLDSRCRMQQVTEGHFPTLDDVPKRAISLTVHALLDVKHALVVVPESRKAPAVKAALQGPVTRDCPASILRTQPNVTLYLDRESASLLQ